MSLLPEDASALEHISAVWLEVTGRAFSPLDLDTAIDWLTRGVPRDVLEEVIKATEKHLVYDQRPGERRLARLVQCKWLVAKAMARRGVAIFGTA